jgi:predicted small integral membrane protein
MFCLTPPSSKNDARYTAAKQWYDSFDLKSTGQGDLILDQARRKYDEQLSGYEKLDGKADSLLKFAATITALLITIVTGWKLYPICFVFPALFFFVTAMILALLARNPFYRPTMTPTKYIIDGIPKTNAPQEWMAAGLFLVTEELTIISNWKGAAVEKATVALCIGILLSTGILFTIPTPVAERVGAVCFSLPEHDRLVAGAFLEGVALEEWRVPECEGDRWASGNYYPLTLDSPSYSKQ